MAKHNLGDLIKRGQEHVDEGYERWDPPAGESLKCSVAQVKVDEQDDGLPRWGLRMKVEKGEFEGKSFWVNVEFSEEWDFINKQAVDAFEALGISAEFLVNSTPEMVGSAAEGKKVVVVAGYRKNKKDKNKPWPNHTLESARTQAPPPPPPAEEDDDDDWPEDED